MRIFVFILSSLFPEISGDEIQQLSERAEEQLWKNEVLGDHNTKSFLCTLWYLLTLHFGLRGCQEHHDNMLVEDFTLNKDVQGTEYITFEENPGKTRYYSLIFWLLTTASTAKIFKNDFHLTFPCCLLDF